MTDSNNNDDWEFTIEDDSQSSSEAELELEKDIPKNTVRNAAPKLELESTEQRRLTRSQLAALERKDVKTKPRYEYADGITRIKAAVVDGIALSILVGIVYALSVWKDDLFKSFSEHIYKDFEYLYFNSASLVLLVMFYLIFFIFPLASSGKSPGKTFFAITCSNTKMKNFGVIKALLRELVFKPMSLVSVIGILFMFFNKKKRGLHDFILGTLVTKD